jgi:probable rRNA maturation factor
LDKDEGQVVPVEVLIEDARWAEARLEALAGHAVAATLEAAGLDPARCMVSLMGCDDARITELNAGFRGKSGPTNVLSWPAEDLSPEAPGALPEAPATGSPDDPAELGDIALAYDTCAREAAAAGLRIDHHVLHLIVHGTLHLLGYDHIRDADAEVMELREVAVLASLGVSDPYS